MSDHPTPLGGTCSARFDPLRELFAAKLESGEDLGASLAFNIDGEMVVDLWGGWADEARTVAVDREHDHQRVLHHQGDDIARRAGAGRSRRTRPRRDRRQVLARVRGPRQGGGQGSPSPVAHLGRLGLGAADHPRGHVRLGQVDRPAGRAAPWWEPGTASGYHALNYGHLIGEVIRRITGQRLGEFFATHLAGPLGADFHIGLSPSEFHRVASVVPPPVAPAPAEPVQLDPNSVAFKSMSNPVMTPETTWTEGWRRADIGAANGHGNARSLARLQSAVACGGEVDGVRLLSPPTIDRIFEVQSNGIDLVIGIPSKWGVGYGLFPEGRGCAFGGYGGSLVVIDADRRMTFAYVMNKMAPGGGTIAAALAERVSEIVKR